MSRRVLSRLYSTQLYFSSDCAAAVRSCNDLAQGKSLHQQILPTGLHLYTYVGNSLIDMYGRCGSIQDAESTFNCLQQRNVFSWTLLISAYVENGYCKEAVATLRRMDLQGVRPVRITFLKLICACCDWRNLSEGRKIHARVADDFDVYLSAALVNLYSKCGSLHEAELVFESTSPKDDFCWTAMIRAYVEQGECTLALELYWEFLLEGLRPREITFLSILSACASLDAVSDGKNVHSQVVQSGMSSNVGLGSRLIHFYGKCNLAGQAFEVLKNLNTTEVVPWNSMLAAYAQLGQHRSAVELYHRMDLEGLRPCTVTYISVVDACTTLEDAVTGRAVHARAEQEGVAGDEVLLGCLVNMYGKSGCLEEARTVLESTSLDNFVSCTAMITSYVQHGRERNALELFHRVEQAGTKVNEVTLLNLLVGFSSPEFLPAGRAMHRRLAQTGHVSDVTVTNALIGMYGRCGSLPDAKEVFRSAMHKNVVSWNSIIGASVQQGDVRHAVEIFQAMDLSGVTPSSISLANVLEGCVQLGDLAKGKAIHSAVRGTILEQDENVRNILINMYTKCGSLKGAEEIFSSSTSVVAWTSMIAAYARHGEFNECLKQSRRMGVEGVKFNHVTFLTVLFACSHAGFVEEGCHCFVLMTRELGFEPSLEQYGCMVDLLGRAGWLREAEEFIGRMHVAANRATWLALLGACKIHRDVHRAVRAAEKILELDPGNSSACSLLESVCNELQEYAL